MLVGTITDAINQLNSLNAKYPLPAIPQVPQIPSAPLPKASGTAQTTQAVIPPPSAPRTLTGTVDVDIGLDWKTIGLVAGGVAILGAGAYLLLRPRRRRRRR